ncbi:hypothetical protein I7X12_01155 [Halosimplex litoreum]|uniref:Uncharacterized protein n=1 Tax=Halosimplex litoreum TaxID=1198301 RepID=A0A7T3FZ19_9EURY|nr:hypothetical protein [Halosimplex litoreum]QPV63271.1 hypothetical protein I7X12_01155 [Halosimplex litoreum]
MTGLPDSPSYEDDETLAKLQQALDDATGVDMRAALEGAIEDRKAEIRREAPASRPAN